MKKMLRMGCTVAALGTGTLLGACQGEAMPELAAESLATVQLALVSVPTDVSCVRANVAGATRSVTRNQDVVPGKASTFSLTGLPSGKVTFDMDAFAVPCIKVAKNEVPTWVADSQTVVLSNGASTPVSVTLRPNAVADVKADFVTDGATPPPPPPPPPPASGLIGHWSFNAVKGSVVADDSGNGNTGEIVQGQTPNSPAVSGVVVPGKVGNALDLSPRNTWVRIKDSDSIDSTGTTGSFTVAAWVKPGTMPDPSGSNSIISRHEVGTSEEHFGLGLRAGKPTATVHFFFTSAIDSLAFGQWTHLAATYDGITSNVYVNGVISNSMDIGWPLAADTTDTIIGAAQNMDTVKEFFAGAVDEVRLYNTSLSTAEVQALSK